MSSFFLIEVSKRLIQLSGVLLRLRLTLAVIGTLMLSPALL
jgi:hypothetical protein